ncbi:unnamed protein product [Prunus armeniaca]|uniref:Uncharacterized protein n=1 Tax=Prunus armeniaca TaxID=36596 RepID=A0A6J5U845_PRUAR|nr:unnamed protein product [Prunus armeniaca]
MFVPTNFLVCGVQTFHLNEPRSGGGYVRVGRSVTVVHQRTGVRKLPHKRVDDGGAWQQSKSVGGVGSMKRGTDKKPRAMGRKPGRAGNSGAAGHGGTREQYCVGVANVSVAVVEAKHM